MNYGSKFRNMFSGIKRSEVLLAIAISIVAGLSYFALYGLHDTGLITTSARGADDAWFDGDLHRNYRSMTDYGSSSHYRVKVHPLYSLETYPPVFIMIRLGIDPYQAVQIVSACLVSIWFLTAYVLFRIIGCVRFDALCFSLFGLCSSAAIFWMSVPETYVLGSISIMMCLILVGYSKHSLPPGWAYVAISSFSLSVTVTNWMVGILATLYGNSRRRTVVITLVALSVVTLLWGLEKYIFPKAVFFIGDREDVTHLFLPKLDRVITVLNAFVFHTIIAPTINIAGLNDHDWPLLSVQNSLPGSTGMLGILASVAWTVSLVVGGWALFTLKGLFPLRAVLTLSLLGQLALHTLYGDETFLYSLHFLPLLLTLVALGALTKFRLPVVAMTALALPLIAVNNWEQFKNANDSAISPRSEMRKKINLRPYDPWPRGDGHIVLAAPGSKENDKAYYEPGGGFSPGVKTFGISIWLTEPNGNLIATSDSIDINQMTQKFQWTSNGSLPRIIASTKYYDAVWKNNGLGSWRLDLSTPPSTPLSLSLLFRSVGPAGGAVRDIMWNGKTILINKRWLVTITPTPKFVYLGEEGKPDWIHAKSEAEDFTSQSGWAYARVELGDSHTWNAIVRDTHEMDDPWFDIESDQSSIHSDLHIKVPDERFSQSLDSQVAHLMMSIVGRETRPGDPTTYPLAWQRDGAYVLVALARAGKLGVARKLAKDFAERDFFGGLGPEADAPGLGIWALMATAEQVRKAEFYNWLWPHIKRKANFIELMCNTQSNIHQQVAGRDVVPGYINHPDLTLVAERPRDGLIVGKVDHHRPVLFINAISYRGLLDAAKLARRLGYTQDASRWEQAAQKINFAWRKAFKTPMSSNDWTYVSALWPSWVAAEMQDEFREQLRERWEKKHTDNDHYKTRPLWTYFEVAEAHQWLFLGNSEKTWSILQWFWNNQSSPGLYSWWAGYGGDNSFRAWDSVRGWVSPAGVTPHYWTAAEMAILQMDMLGYIDDASHPVLVIGNGVPAEWTIQDMSVKGLRLNELNVDWQWQNQIMNIYVKGTKKIDVRLGSGFPQSSKVKVIYLDS